MTVLVLARDFDPTADAVVQHLNAADVPVFRTDLGDFPERLKLDARLHGGVWTGSLWNEHRRVELAELRAIWNRNPSTYRFPATMTPQEQDFAHREAKLGLGGVLAALDVLWVNHPNRCADALFKPYQWKIAAECGLLVAQTLITNDPDTAMCYGSSWPVAVTKALGPAGLREDGVAKVAFTRILTAEELADLRAVAVTATTIQEFVPKAYEVRLTVIGERRWFPIAIHAGTAGSRTDWRSDPTALSYEPVPIPAPVADGVARYLARTGLVVAGLDFVVTPDDEWVFLEANTGPQWGWLESATGADIAAALAEVLARGLG